MVYCVGMFGFQFFFEWVDEGCEYVEYQCVVGCYDVVQCVVGYGVDYDWLVVGLCVVCFDFECGGFCFFCVIYEWQVMFVEFYVFELCQDVVVDCFCGNISGIGDEENGLLYGLVLVFER